MYVYVTCTLQAIASLDRRRRFNDPGVFCIGMGAFCPIFD